MFAYRDNKIENPAAGEREIVEKVAEEKAAHLSRMIIRMLSGGHFLRNFKVLSVLHPATTLSLISRIWSPNRSPTIAAGESLWTKATNMPCKREFWGKRINKVKMYKHSLWNARRIRTRQGANIVKTISQVIFRISETYLFQSIAGKFIFIDC